MAYDLLIKNARIIDGSGSPSFEGSVAVEGGVIQSVGQVSLLSRRNLCGHRQLLPFPGSRS